MSEGTLGCQLDADTEGVNTHDPHLDDMSNQVRVNLSPPSRREFMDVSTFHHGALNHSPDQPI